MSKQIFRAYDIRGEYPSELNEELAEKIGIAFGNFIDADEVVIGRDNRFNSKKIEESLINGILKSGKNVVKVGMVPTPVLYFAINHLNKGGGIIVTGSHLPKKYGGMKLKKEKAVGFSSEEIKEIGRKALDNELVISEKPGTISERSVDKEYIDHLSKIPKLGKKLKIVIDAGNGACGKTASELFEKLGCEVIRLYCEPDGEYPNHMPDPHEAKNMEDLKKKVVEEKADLGIAYDGDGDRAGFVDHKGRIISGDKTAIVFLRDALKNKKGPIVFDVRISLSAVEDVKKNGGSVIIYKVGHSKILQKMFETDAVFGAELTGHMFFNYCYYSYDDGIFASMKMVEIVSNTDDFCKYLDEIPEYFSTPEERISCPDDKKFQIIQKIKENLQKKYKVNDVDGIRIDFEDGWGLLRASNTAPQLTMRFEAKSEERLHQIKKIFLDELNNHI